MSKRAIYTRILTLPLIPKTRPVYAHCGILGIGIMKAYREQGIGKALIQKTLEKARHMGLTRIELAVREDNTHAIALYKKLGFVTEGLQLNAIRVEGVYQNLITMGLLLE